jgi:hypothetical protein
MPGNETSEAGEFTIDLSPTYEGHQDIRCFP